MALARVDPREIAEALRRPENAALLAMSILVYDLAHYKGIVTLKDVVDRCLAPRVLCERNLRKLEEMGIIEIRGGEVVLTPEGRKAVELARWGKEFRG